SSDSNSLLTVNQDNTAGGNGWSLAPTMSADGRTLVFPTWASDLVSSDNNRSGDLLTFAFLYASITPDLAGPIITWPRSAGYSYGVQFKPNLNDASWQTLSGTVNVTGNRASMQDSAGTTALSRFYRVIQF